MKLPSTYRQRGISLVEAIVALGVMAFGMLALVGVQSTLRNNGDLARQRTEAVRIAQERLESFRAFAALTGTTGGLDFDEIVSAGRTAVTTTGTALDGRLNTTFSSTVTAAAATHTAPVRPITVVVDWTDRLGQFQSVVLHSVLAGLPPELPGSLALPPARLPFSAPLGRNRQVPLTAFSLPQQGVSIFRPPQGESSTPVAWIFNNVTGLVTGRCTLTGTSNGPSITAEQAAACLDGRTAVSGQLISGYVRFAAGDPTAGGNSEAELPSGSVLNLRMRMQLTSDGHPSPGAECYDDAPTVSGSTTLEASAAYYCLISSNSQGLFSGRLRVEPLAFADGSAWTIGTGSTQFKVCRYTPLSSDTGTRNLDHPLDYTASGSPAFAGLSNQNFLVIGGAFSCPVETPTDNDAFNTNTRLHQDGGSTYDNPSS